MNLEETLAVLESLGDEKRRALNVKNGAGKAELAAPIRINEMVRRQG